MSKAFVNEQGAGDDLDDEEEEKSPVAAAGGKNYITPAGFRKLQAEFTQLKSKERPELVKVIEWAAGNGDRSENGDYIYGKRRLREIDRRLRFLSRQINAAEVVDPTTITSDQVLFGATVTVRDEDDRERRYTIVGVDEIDIERGRISWVSPLATALFKAHLGDIVTFRAPKGPVELEIIDLRYETVTD